MWQTPRAFGRRRKTEGLSLRLENRDLKQEIKRRHPAWFEMHPYGEVLPYAHNRITVGDAGTDRYGVPVVKIDYKIGDNERKMAEHMADTAEAIAKLVAVPEAQRNDAQKAELLAYYRGLDARWVELNQGLTQASAAGANERLIGVQDLAWALINSPAFLFNR